MQIYTGEAAVTLLERLFRLWSLDEPNPYCDLPWVYGIRLQIGDLEVQCKEDA